MYKIKPIVQVWPDVSLPQTMYNMKSIVNLQLEDTVNPNISIELSEIDLLAARQEKILHQIEKFKKQLASIKKGMVEGQKKPEVTKKVAEKAKGLKAIDTKELKDFVVNVNPSHIPYSILGIKQLWQHRLALEVEFFTHSTVSSQLSEDVKNFMNKVKSIKTDSGLPSLKVTVIWKNVTNNLEIVNSPTSYSALLGEVNLVRYFSRIGPNESNYEELANATEIDSILDVCYLLVNATNLKDKQTHLRILNTKLGKQQYFGNSAKSIVDVACSSTISQLDGIKDLPPALKSWHAKVTRELGYQS